MYSLREEEKDKKFFFHHCSLFPRKQFGCQLALDSKPVLPNHWSCDLGKLYILSDLSFFMYNISSMIFVYFAKAFQRFKLMVMHMNV